VPDADATVDLTVHGTPLRFAGLGYHDKNWGLAPFAADVAHTYWGHARVGPYSVVWSNALVPTGSGNATKEYFSGAVAKDGRLITVSCAQDASVVRPWGANDAYPPTYSTGPPQGLAISFDLGAEGALELNVTSYLTVINVESYQRQLGSVKGGLKGCKEEYEGKALYEQFKLIGVPGS
jgi:hypothetical protein